MQAWWWLPFAAAISFFALWGASLLLGAWRLTRFRWRAVNAQRVDWCDVPADENAILEAAQPLLERLGFEPARVEASEFLLSRPDHVLTYTAVHRHRDGQAYALVTRNGLPEAGQLAVIRWVSCFDDGRTWITSNRYRHYSLVADKQQTHFDDDLTSDEAAFARHRQRVAQDGGRLVDDASAADARLTAITDDYLASLVRGGMVRIHDDGFGRLRWPAALRWMRDITRGQRRVAKLVQRERASAVASDTPASPAANEHVAIEADVRAFTDQLALLQSAPIERRSKWVVLGVTAVLFLLAAGWWMGWSFAIVLLVVIALHEGGHYLAMKWTGYRNLSVFFLPGLGAMAVGEKPQATPFEKLAVYLAGPVPGLVIAVLALLAMGRMQAPPPEWLRQLVFVSLFVNALNLLPITPLDGGRVVDALLLARRPWLRFGFALLGFGALLAFGLYIRDPVTTVIAFVVAMSLPVQWHATRLHAKLPRARDEVLDEPAAVRRLCEAMRNAPFSAWPFARRAGIARMLLPELQGPRAGWHHALIGGAVYVACLAVPLALAYHESAVLRWPGWNGANKHVWPIDDVDNSVGSCPRPSAPVEPLEARLKRLDDLPVAARIDTLIDAADEARSNDREDHAREHLERAWVLAKDKPADDEPRARVMLALADVASDRAQAEVWLRRVVQDLEGPSSSLATGQGAAALELLAQAKEQLSWRAESAQRVEWLRQALVHRLAAPQTPWAVPMARSELARALYAAGDKVEAEAPLRDNVEAATLLPPDNRSRRALNDRVARVDALTELGWLLLDRQRVAEARVVLDEAKSIEAPRVTRRWARPSRMLAEQQLWVAMAEGDADAMRAALARIAEFEGAPSYAWNGAASEAIDRLLAARKLGDEASQREAQAAWRKATAKSGRHGFCDEQRDPQETSTWRDFQQRERSRAAVAEGWCGR